MFFNNAVSKLGPIVMRPFCYELLFCFRQKAIKTPYHNTTVDRYRTTGKANSLENK